MQINTFLAYIWSSNRKLLQKARNVPVYVSELSITVIPQELYMYLYAHVHSQL